MENMENSWKLAGFGLEKWKNIVRDSNSTLKLLTLQLSNVRELETIKYAFGVTALKLCMPISDTQDNL